MFRQLKHTIFRILFPMLNKGTSHFSHTPLMSVLMPVYNTESEILKKSITSVLRQTYKNWELCIADDASALPHVREILNHYAKKDPRVRVLFSSKNKGIAGNINSAASMASGEYVGVLDHDDELMPMTLWEYVWLVNEHSDADCIYCDEDKIDEQGNYCDPWFKSDWNPDLALSFNYVMHFAMYRRTLFEKLGGVCSDYEGSQDYDLLLRATEQTDKIYHIPRILYHWRMGPGSIAGGPEAKPDVFVKGLAALNDTLKRRNIEGCAEDAQDAWKGVYRVRRKLVKSLPCSVIVYSRGNIDALNRLLYSIALYLPEKPEILVCVPSSAAAHIRHELSEFSNIRWIRYNGNENISAALNQGANHAQGDVLFFLDETMELMTGESYTALLEHAQRNEVGAVNGKIYYANGLVEHGGIILGPFGIMGYAHRATPDNPGYAGLKNMIGNYSAVMGFGMMTRRKVFQDAGGFDETLSSAYWDADYCLRLRQKGYLMTYTPYAAFHHHIPVHTIHEMIQEPDASLFKARWRHMIDNDPCFNPNFSRKFEDFSRMIPDQRVSRFLVRLMKKIF